MRDASFFARRALARQFPTRLSRQRGFLRLMPTVGIWPAGRGFRCSGADFDGTNDYMRRSTGGTTSWTGAADSKLGTFFCCLRLDGGNGANMEILGQSTDVAPSDQALSIRRNSSNVFQFLMNMGGRLNMVSNVSYTSSPKWLTLLASWDVAVASGGACHLYVNDDNVKGTTTTVNAVIDYTGRVADIGAFEAGLKFNGCMAEFWWGMGVFIDFSSVANRRKFVRPNGKPMYLGESGQLPTGTSPIAYFRMKPGEAATNFGTNRGTGGNPVITGTLDIASTNPTDIP